MPYIANWIYEHPAGLDLSLKGIWIADPSLSYNLVQQEIPALRFAQVYFILDLFLRKAALIIEIGSTGKQELIPLQQFILGPASANFGRMWLYRLP